MATRKYNVKSGQRIYASRQITRCKPVAEKKAGLKSRIMSVINSPRFAMILCLLALLATNICSVAVGCRYGFSACQDTGAGWPIAPSR